MGPAKFMADWRTVALLIGVALAGCSEGSPSEPPTPPAISVTGVEEGGVYTEPVMVSVEVDRGSYSATLDGTPFLSGSTVAELGDHTLIVEARVGEAASSRTVGFRIEVPEGGVLIVRMFDLGDNSAGGGGDAILLTDSAEGFQRHVLVDAGPAGVDGSDPDHVAQRLQALGVESLEALVLTHAHSDHFNGMPAVLASLDVARFIYNGQSRYYSGYTSVIDQAHARADTVIVPANLLTVPLSGDDGTVITLLPPLDSYLNDPNADGHELNEGSLGAAVTRDAFSMFMTGDGEREANRRWRQDFSALTGEVDVLKVGHHGANNAIFDVGSSGASSWLDHTDPEVALISANGETHPLYNALARIMSRSNTRTYCTNVHGDIELRVDANGTIRVTTERNPEEDCQAAG